MTTTELIAILRQYPANTKVLVNGYEGNYTDIEAVNAIVVSYNEVYKNSVLGPYEEFDTAYHSEAIAAVAIERN